MCGVITSCVLGLTLDHTLIWEKDINILHNKLKFSVTKLLTRVDEKVFIDWLILAYNTRLFVGTVSINI